MQDWRLYPPTKEAKYDMGDVLPVHNQDLRSYEVEAIHAENVSRSSALSLPASRHIPSHSVNYHMNSEEFRQKSKRCSFTAFAISVCILIMCSVAVAMAISITAGSSIVIHMRITNRQFTLDLLDSSSREYINLSSSICSQVDEIYNNSSLNQKYDGCTVTDIREGSVIVQFLVRLTSSYYDDTAASIMYLAITRKDSGSATIFYGLDIEERNLKIFVRGQLWLPASDKLPVTVTTSSSNPSTLRPTSPLRTHSNSHSTHIFTEGRTTSTFTQPDPKVTTHLLTSTGGRFSSWTATGSDSKDATTSAIRTGTASNDNTLVTSIVTRTPLSTSVSTKSNKSITNSVESSTESLRNISTISTEEHMTSNIPEISSSTLTTERSEMINTIKSSISSNTISTKKTLTEVAGVITGVTSTFDSSVKQTQMSSTILPTSESSTDGKSEPTVETTSVEVSTQETSASSDMYSSLNPSERDGALSTPDAPVTSGYTVPTTETYKMKSSIVSTQYMSTTIEDTITANEEMTPNVSDFTSEAVLPNDTETTAQTTERITVQSTVSALNRTKSNFSYTRTFSGVNDTSMMTVTENPTDMNTHTEDTSAAFQPTPSYTERTSEETVTTQSATEDATVFTTEQVSESLAVESTTSSVSSGQIIESTFEDGESDGWKAQNYPWLNGKTATSVAKHSRMNSSYSLRVRVDGSAPAIITRCCIEKDIFCLTGKLGDSLTKSSGAVIKITTNATLLVSDGSQIRLDIATRRYLYSAVVTQNLRYGDVKTLPDGWLEYSFGDHKLTRRDGVDSYARLTFNGLKVKDISIDDIIIRC